jgi:hypothetical protein
MTSLFPSLQAACLLVVRQDGFRLSDINLERWAVTYRSSPEQVEQELKIAMNGKRKLPEEVAAASIAPAPLEEVDE